MGLKINLSFTSKLQKILLNKYLEKRDIDPGAPPEAPPGAPGQVQELNSSIEEIFLFTLNKYSVIGGQFSQLIFLSGLADVVGQFIYIHI